MDLYVRTVESMRVTLLARRQQYMDEESESMLDRWSKLRVMMKTVIIQVPGFGTLRDKRRCLHRLTDADQRCCTDLISYWLERVIFIECYTYILFAMVDVNKSNKSWNLSFE